MPDRLPFPCGSWDNVGSNLHRGAIRSVCGSVPRNGCFRGYHTNTARGESKTPISRNRGEIGGKAREHIPRELIERDSKNGFYLGRRFDRRKWRDVPILETRTHNPEVVGSNPAPATMKLAGRKQRFRPFLYSGDRLHGSSRVLIATDSASRSARHRFESWSAFNAFSRASRIMDFALSSSSFVRMTTWGILAF